MVGQSAGCTDRSSKRPVGRYPASARELGSIALASQNGASDGTETSDKTRIALQQSELHVVRSPIWQPTNIADMLERRQAPGGKKWHTTASKFDPVAA